LADVKITIKIIIIVKIVIKNNKNKNKKKSYHVIVEADTYGHHTVVTAEPRCQESNLGTCTRKSQNGMPRRTSLQISGT
jgi:hypothetical protein